MQRLGPPAGEAKIIAIAKEGDETLVELERLPDKAEFLFRGHGIEDFMSPGGRAALAEANVFLNCKGEII